jgi:octaprenyl-diphosphate synthase
MEAYGRSLGIAFQVADDILDVVGNEVSTGKSLGTDLDQRKPTLPLIRLLEVADPATRQQALGLIDREAEGRHEMLHDLMAEHGAICYAEGIAKQYAAQASQCLDALPASAATQALHSLTDFVVRRSR